MHIETFSEILDFSAIQRARTRGAAVCLFIRHSERPPICPNDREFGRTLGLTVRGVERARDAGRRLACATDARFCASPMTRCRLTAHHLAEGMGFAHPVVEDADALGVRGFFYDDPYAVQEIMREQGYMAYMLAYLRDGIAPHSRPLGEATAQTLAWLTTESRAGFNLFVSHDIFVAAILTGLRLRTYTQEEWVGFLHGFALIREPDATRWCCHPCVPQHAETAAAAPFVQ